MRKFVFIWILLSFAFGLKGVQAQPEFHILQTGQTQGIASHYSYKAKMPYFLLHQYYDSRSQLLKRFDVTETRAYFYQNGTYIWGEHLDITNFHLWLKDGGLNQAPESDLPISALHTKNANTFSLSANSQLFVKMKAHLLKSKTNSLHIHVKPARLRVYAQGVYRLDLGVERSLSSDPGHWEFLFGQKLQIEPEGESMNEVIILGKAKGEGSRRLALMQKLRQKKSLLLDSGNILEGLSSVKTGQLSLQRPNSLKMISQLKYNAITVGHNELRGGLNHLLKEMKAYQLPLISANLILNKEFLFPPYKLFKQDGHTLVVIGLSKISDLKEFQERGLLPKDVTVLSHEDALLKVFSALDKEGIQGPQVKMVLSNSSLSELQNLIQNQRGIYAVLSSHGQVFQALDKNYKAPNPAYPHPYLLGHHPDSLHEISFNLKPREFNLRSKSHPIKFELPTDKKLLKEVMAIRQKVYSKEFDILIPNLKPFLTNDPQLAKIYSQSQAVKLEEKQFRGFLNQSVIEPLSNVYPPHMTRELLGNLELNLLMRYFQSELAVIRLSPKMDLSVPGALPRFLVYDLFRTDDTLHIYHLTGKQIKALFALKKINLAFGGLSSDGNKVWQRLLQPKEVYKVVIPSSVGRLKPVKSILLRSRVQTQLEDPWTRRKQALYLRPFILKSLDELSKHRDYHARLASLFKPKWVEKMNLWSFSLDDLQLKVSGYNAMGNESYAAVRETRVTSPDSFSFGGRGRLALGFENDTVGLLNAVSSKFDGLSVLAVGQEKFTENQDDLLFSSELKLRLFRFKLLDTNFELIPYVEGIYDTEFTPTLNQETKLNNPLQSELSGVLGFQIPSGKLLRVFKSGAAIKRDFNVLNNIELGFNFRAVHEWPLGSHLKWKNDLDLKYFLPSVNDNETSLGFVTKWTSAFDVLVTENLSLQLYADSYVFRGKLPVTSDFGASVILGVGLSYGRFWKPWYEWFD